MSTLRKTIQKRYEDALKKATQLNEARKLINRLPREMSDQEFDYIDIGVSTGSNSKSWRDIEISIHIDASYFNTEAALGLKNWLDENVMVAWNDKIEYQGYAEKFLQKGVMHNCGNDIDIQIDSLPKPDDCEIVAKIETYTRYEVVCNK